MKDKEARESIEELERTFHDRIKVLERTGITVKNCPRCKHPVLALADWALSGGPRFGYVHQCLTCGSNFTYKETEQLLDLGE